MKKLKFLLINPTSPLWRVKDHQRPVNSSVFRFSMLPSLYVAASMPDFVETKILDEDVEPVDFKTDAEIIGFTFMTYNAPRAYELADKFRALGKTVFFGGYHPSFMPEEAIQHANAICIGESENNIPKMIHDYLKGNLKLFYSYKNIFRRVRRTFGYLHPDLIGRAVIPLNLGYRFKLSKYNAFELANSFQPK